MTPADPDSGRSTLSRERNRPILGVYQRAYAAIGEEAWSDARDMHGAQVAATGYAPAGFPPGSYTIVRRVTVPAGEISVDPRSRRRRTIPAGQLALVLEGVADHAWAVSVIVMNIPPTSPRGSSPSSTGSAAARTSRRGSRRPRSARRCVACRPATR
ncbi:hypothetical protein [Frankia sp. Cj3]|uniref:hypothetical protein n=1 Tax=Frankia sp. Cj3 TaxID=2880976 RepID=UPI001EF5154E|nr:hypothetical protein [Frankia sp. Cj3]